ncbi:hypothetical protein D3C73_574650 [compost metagenome]
MLTWLDQQGDTTSEVELLEHNGLNAGELSDFWLLSHEDYRHAVEHKETLSIQVRFKQAGTYSLNVVAVKEELK